MGDKMQVIVIGGGASGLLASSMIAERGHDVTVLEKNEKTGKKLYITGKGRCNVTNDCSPSDFLENVVTNAKFIQSAIYGFPPEKTMETLENYGLRLTVERGNRVFPSSNKSSDVIKTLSKACDKAGVTTVLNAEVVSVAKNSDGKFEIKTRAGENYSSDAVVIATGGVSYPLTGSTGDGYAFAKSFGHGVVEPKPSLCPIWVKEKETAKELEGLSLKNVEVNVFKDGRKIFSQFGEMMFTANGISGPVVLTISAEINKTDMKNIAVSIDLKPALTTDELDKRVLGDFGKYSNKEFKNALNDLLPKKLIPVIVKLSEIPENTKVNLISSKMRKKLVNLLKNFTFNVLSLAPISEAVVTSGGINVKEINPKTFESKLVKNLFFIGEVLDVDAYTGGFNLQIAWSTAYAVSRALG